MGINKGEKVHGALQVPKRLMRGMGPSEGRERETMTSSERRRHPRHHVQSDAVVMLFHDTEIVFSERILDISKGGLAFSYYGWKEWTDSSQSVDILDARYYIDKLLVSVVSDRGAIDGEPGTFSLRRCGLSFHNLNEFQLSQIAQFIHKYAVSPE